MHKSQFFITLIERGDAGASISGGMGTRNHHGRMRLGQIAQDILPYRYTYLPKTRFFVPIGRSTISKASKQVEGGGEEGSQSQSLNHCCTWRSVLQAA